MLQTMETYSHHWQAMLEKIPDYLTEGEGKWWSRQPSGDIEFFDVQLPNSDALPDKPPLFHYRSTNSVTVFAHLADKWKECLESNIALPVHTLHDYDVENRKHSATFLDESEEEECSQNTVISVRIQTNITDDFIRDSHGSDHESPQVQKLTSTGTSDNVQTPMSQPTTPNSPQQHATEEKPTSTAHNSTYDTQTPKRKVRTLTSPINSMLTSPHTPAEQYTYRTKLGAALAKLFGTNDKDTIALDKAKHASKQQPTSRILKSKFQEMESKASTKVLQIHSQCDDKVCAWEKLFICEHSRFPNKRDIQENPLICNMYKQRHLTKELLQSWNITIHK